MALKVPTPSNQTSIKPANRAPRLATLVRNRLIKAAQSLPQSIDDAERKYGLKLYDDMLATSVDLSSAYHLLRDRVFEHGITITPAIDAPITGSEDDKPENWLDHLQAVEIATFCQQILDDLDARHASPLVTLRTMFNAVKYGRSLAEMTFDYVADGDFKNFIGLSALRFIPRQNYSVVSDPFGRILGVIGIEPGKASPIVTGIIPEPTAFPNFVPSQRLFYLVVNPADEHPGGLSMLRPAYRSWWAVRQVEPVELQALGQFGGEGLFFIAGEKAFEKRTIKSALDGDQTTTEIEYVAQMMADYQAGSYAIFPNGWSAMEIGGNGNAEGFKTFFERHERKMVETLLYSASTIKEAERNSQAKASQTADIADVAVSSLQWMIGNAFAQQVIRPLVALNWNESVAKRFTPHVVLKHAPTPDRASILSAISSALQSGAISRAMLPTIWRKWLGEDYVADSDQPDPETNEGKKNEKQATGSSDD